MNPRKRRMLKMRVRASKDVKVAPEVSVVEAPVEAPKKVAPTAPKKERVVKKTTKKSSAKKSS